MKYYGLLYIYRLRSLVLFRSLHYYRSDLIMSSYDATAVAMIKTMEMSGIHFYTLVS